MVAVRPRIESPFRMRFAEAPWDYEIQVALPASYATTEQAFPVLWVTDGSLLFDTAVEAVGFLQRSRIPEMIVVGIGAPAEAASDTGRRRAFDFSVGSSGWGFAGRAGELSDQVLREVEESSGSSIDAGPLGGAERFLRFLVEEVRPEIERRYRTAGDHVLFGHSAGGHFALAALFTRPDAFGRYIVLSPNAYGEDDVVFDLEDGYARAHDDLAARVFLGAGSAEILQGGAVSVYGCASGAIRMAELLRARNYPSLGLHVALLEGEDHGSVVPPGMVAGLSALFAPEATNPR